MRIPFSALISLLLLLPILLLPGCSQQNDKSAPLVNGCMSCHKVKLDENHSFKCTRCHKGSSNETLKDRAHKGLIKSPSSPSNAPAVCGECHFKEVGSVQLSKHYTLQDEIAAVWKSFFPKDNPPKVKDIHGVKKPKNERDLVRDMLARRCLRCHVYYRGDSYSGTLRGKGCAACHMEIGNRQNHAFKRPTIKNCLACHYGNFVGWDYVGRFEKDYPEDFRAPLKKGQHIERPYGIEWLPMTPDIHFQAGLSCTDCHKKSEFHVKPGGSDKDKRASCLNCHGTLSGRTGHRQDGSCVADCQACHATWVFWDQGRSLIRQDSLDPEDWMYLYVQGSSEVEKEIKESLDLVDLEQVRFFMTDKINAKPYPGLWLAGFEKRRWAPVILGKDHRGHISVLRPLLDLSLSYSDELGETVFDNLHSRNLHDWQVVYPPVAPLGFNPSKSVLSSYVPHTIGKADFVRSIFVGNMLRECSEH